MHRHRSALLASNQVSLARAGVEDVAFIREVTVEEPCPEYGGFNTQHAHRCVGQPSPKASIMYTPVLDMTPAHPGTMETAVAEAQRLTQLTGQVWTVFTNDQQAHRIAMHACWEEHPMFSKCVTKLGDI